MLNYQRVDLLIFEAGNVSTKTGIQDQIKICDSAKYGLSHGTAPPFWDPEDLPLRLVSLDDDSPSDMVIS